MFYELKKNITRQLIGNNKCKSNKINQLATIIEDTNINNDESIITNNSLRQDGHFSMMEFAMMNFRQSIDK